MVPIILEANSYLTGSTLRDVSLRDYGCMVVSVLRGDEIITNPRPDFHFAEGDTVWIAGDISSLDWISN
ncbi:MAG: TrkA C-terminal domain-containing protein [Bacteroidales bacterium]|nr:TrkA C-terminal domain-containing protein [Bacteroidales bacterium]